MNRQRLLTTGLLIGGINILMGGSVLTLGLLGWDVLSALAPGLALADCVVGCIALALGAWIILDAARCAFAMGEQA